MHLWRIALLLTTMATFSSAGIQAFLSAVYGKTKPRPVFSVSVTGGGVQALQWLFSTPGSSRCLMEGQVPYSRSSLEGYLGGVGSTSVSAETASHMSAVARTRAAQTLLAESGGNLASLAECNVFGVACTAALASTSQKKGTHRCHVAVSEMQQTRIFSLTLEKGRRTREAEDSLCSRLILDALEAAVEGDSSLRFCSEELASGEVVERSVAAGATGAEAALERVRDGRAGHALFVPRRVAESGGSDGDISSPLDAQFACMEDVQLPRGTLVFPGSFNPLHAGHVELVVAALKSQQRASPSAAEDETSAHVPVVFEIAAVNVDKPPLGRDEMVSRLQGLVRSPLLAAAGIHNFGVSFTSAPLFVRKSSLFPLCTFVIGADTMARLVTPKYYSPPAIATGAATATPADQAVQASHAMIAALATIAERKCSFVVGGRVQQGKDKDPSKFDTLHDILRGNTALPPSITNMFIGIEESEFRADISSSEIRGKG